MALVDLVESGLADRYTVLERAPSTTTSWFPAEILTCRGLDGETVRLLCKRGGGLAFGGHGHRGGVAREAAVYRHVLARLNVTAPRFHGAFTDPHTGEPCLVIEFVEGATTADGARDAPRALETAARWAARFHNLTAESDLAFPLPRYDEAYYSQWANRTLDLAGRWRDRLDWLEDFVAAARSLLAGLAQRHSTVIHGEFTPHNVLVRDGVVFPVDWESAAVGLPEIDLVSLIDGWPASVARRCVRGLLGGALRSSRAGRLATTGGRGPAVLEPSMAGGSPRVDRHRGSTVALR